MSLYDMLIEKERERKEKVKTLLVKAFKRAKLDYEDCTVWKFPEKPGYNRIILMLQGKVVDKLWWNRIVISYLSKLAQKLVEKGDIAVW